MQISPSPGIATAFPERPSIEPTNAPIVQETLEPGVQATAEPSVEPSIEPTAEPELSVPGILQPLPSTEANITESEDDKEAISASEVVGIGLDEPESTKKPVEHNSVKVRTITLPKAIRMVTGGTITIEPEYSPLTAEISTFYWKSSNIRIATVREGTVTAKKPGTVDITVKTPSGKWAKCRITIANQ